MKSGASTNFLINRLGARSLIRDLEENTSSYHQNGKLKPGVSQEFVSSEITTFSLKWNIVSSLTSFVTTSEKIPENPVPQSMEVWEPTPNARSNVQDRGRDRDRASDRDDRDRVAVSYQPRYRERSRSRSRERAWRPRERSRSPVRYSVVTF